ncbi:pentapeptide repeat-containing protein [Amycolatopsis mediterranei]
MGRRHGACLSWRDFGGDTLTNLDLDRAKLAGTTLFATVFRGVRLQGSDLSDTSAEHSERLGFWPTQLS